MPAPEEKEGVDLVDAFHSHDLHVYETVVENGMVGFRFEFASTRDTAGVVKSEVKVYAHAMEGNEGKSGVLPPPELVFGPSDLNLLAGTWRNPTGLAGTLAKDRPQYDFIGILQKIIPMTIDKHRGFLHTTTSYDWEQDFESHPFMLDPFIAAAGVTVLFGAGGLGKSTLAVALAMGIMTGEPVIGDFVHKTGPVLWIDYEADEDEVMEREAATRRQLGIEKTEYPLHYVKLRSKFTHSASTIRKRIRDTGAVMAVVDSVANARRGDANTPEDTINMFAVMGSLDIPILAIDHMSRAAVKAGDMSNPYGTVFTSNEARLTWAIAENEDVSVPTKRQLNLTMAKQNRFKNAAKRGVSVEYTEYDTGIVRTLDFVENMGVWEDGLTTTQRVLRALRATPSKFLIIHEVAESGDLNGKTAEKELKRLFDEGIIDRRKLEGKGGPMGYREKAASQ